MDNERNPSFPTPVSGLVKLEAKNSWDVTLCSLLLLQTFMESQRMEKKKRRLKAIKSIENWPSLEKLSVNLKEDIILHLKHNWEKSITDSVGILFELPTDLKRSVESKLILESLKKEGDTIDNMVFIVQGMLEVHSSHVEVNPIKLLKGGDCCEEEEVTWDVFNNDISSELPRSTMTIKAHTRVLALILPANTVSIICTWIFPTTSEGA